MHVIKKDNSISFRQIVMQHYSTCTIVYNYVESHLYSSTNDSIKLGDAT